MPPGYKIKASGQPITKSQPGFKLQPVITLLTLPLFFLYRSLSLSSWPWDTPNNFWFGTAQFALIFVKKKKKA